MDADPELVNRFIGNGFMPLVEEMGLLRDMPSTIFHYTNGDGLLGILSTGQIHAKSYAFLNDPVEKMYLPELAAEISETRLRRLPENISHVDDHDEITSPEKLERAFLEVPLKPSRDLMEFSPYIASFSEARDLMSQWRAYGANGRGSSISLDPVRLVEVVRSIDDLRIWRVLYRKEEHVHLIERLITIVCDTLKEEYFADSSEEHRRLCFGTAAICFNRMLATFSPVAKHPAYSEEREWRLVYESTDLGQLFDSASGGGDAKQLEPLSLKNQSEQLVPFVSIPVDLPKSPTTFREIVTGPCQSGLSISSVRLLLHKHGRLARVRVAPSELPYRIV